MKKYLSIILCLALFAALLSGCAGKDADPASSTTTVSKGAKPESTAASTAQILDKGSYTGKITAEMTVRDYGTITLELDADAAPITVTNFVNLAKAGFYDGLTFHRIMSGFMIQGGDPLGNGTGGSNQRIKGEFAENGVENSIKHERGTISMARSSAYDSASSQFFIVHETSQRNSLSLDGKYAAFGRVTSGMDVVDKLANVPVTDSNGTVQKANQPIIEKVTITGGID